MKVYVVWEYAVIEYEECFRNMGVFSSEEKAKAAIKEYEEAVTLWRSGRREYNCEEFELDQIWEGLR